MSKIEAYKVGGGNYKSQAESSDTSRLIQMYQKYSDFKEFVDLMVESEKKNNGHCGAVQDASRLAGLISYNSIVQKKVRRLKG